MLSVKEAKAIRQIRNDLVHKGKATTVRDLAKALGFNSPRTGSLMISRLVEKGYLRRKSKRDIQVIKNIHDDRSSAKTIDVPVVGTISCGTPILAEENIEMKIPVSNKIVPPPYKYFFLRASGDSMDLAGINDGDLVLVRQQQTAQDGDKVLALIDDEATIKEYHSYSDHVILKPRSTNKKYKPIVLTRDFQIQGVVITAVPGGVF